MSEEMVRSAKPTACLPPTDEAGGGANNRERLLAAIEAGQALGKLALYFGCWDQLGHYLHGPNGRTIWDARRDHPGFPWTDALMDGGLLKNGKRPDIYDGKVFWTCGGAKSFWYAFYWWDNSVDRRGASNSGFYVRGFGWPEAQAAFDYACTMFPKIVSRQAHALILQANAAAVAHQARAAAPSNLSAEGAQQIGAADRKPTEPNTLSGAA